MGRAKIPDVTHAAHNNGGGVTWDYEIPIIQLDMCFDRCERTGAHGCALHWHWWVSNLQLSLEGWGAKSGEGTAER